MITAINQFFHIRKQPELFFYFLIFLILGAVTGYAPYDFMNVSVQGVWPVIQLTIFMMMPAIIILSAFLLYLKNLLESKIEG